MPYIDQMQRERIDHHMVPLRYLLAGLSEDDIEGALNYSITALIESISSDDRGAVKWRYKLINRAIGVLECVKLEFYRRLAGPYEDIAIDKNGDIDAYKYKGF